MKWWNVKTKLENEITSKNEFKLSGPDYNSVLCIYISNILRNVVMRKKYRKRLERCSLRVLFPTDRRSFCFSTETKELTFSTESVKMKLGNSETKWGIIDWHHKSYFSLCDLRCCAWSNLTTCHSAADVRAKHLRWLTHIETVCSVTCTILWRGEKRGGVLNASVHDEAAIYGDRVCHLILRSFHHNLPHHVQRKAHWRPSALDRCLGHHTEIYLWPILTIHYTHGSWINRHRLKFGGV